jgi:uncharacterized protein
MRRFKAAAWLSGLLVAGAMSLPLLAAPTELLDDAAQSDRVTQAKVHAYRDLLARYDAAIAADPENADLGVARCRFMARHLEEDNGEWIEASPHDHEACIEDLGTRWPQAPIVRLYRYQQQPDGDALADGEALLEEATDWPSPVRRDLLADLAQRYEDADEDSRAGVLALEAARLGDAVSVARALDSLRKGDPAEAAALLREAPAAPHYWAATERIETALKFDDPMLALDELRRYDAGSFRVAPALAARVYLHAGDVVAAQNVLKDVAKSDEALRAIRFDVALAAADWPAAAAQVQLTDAEHAAENLQRFAVLLRKSPAMAVQPTMLLAGLTVLLMLVFFLVLPAALLVPVHYRGLVRRTRGRSQIPLFATVGLRHAWWGLVLAMAVPVLIAGAIEPASLASLLGEGTPAGGTLFRVGLWGSLACLLLLAPLLPRLMHVVGVAERPAPLRQAAWVLAAWIGVYAIGLVQAAWSSLRAVDTETLQTRTVDALINGGTAEAGWIAAFALVAVLVPIVEEVVFRGLLLGGMTRHISFGWANLAQALLFAAFHSDPPRFVFYAALGVLAGLLVRKGGTLWPAIGLHALNNAVAFVLLSR